MKVTGQLHALVTLPLSKESLVPIEWETQWAPETVWTLWKREKSLAPASSQSMIPWVSSPHQSHPTYYQNYEAKLSI
jgi:hypothetical protein